MIKLVLDAGRLLSFLRSCQLFDFGGDILYDFELFSTFGLLLVYIGLYLCDLLSILLPDLNYGTLPSNDHQR